MRFQTNYAQNNQIAHQELLLPGHNPLDSVLADPEKSHLCFTNFYYDLGYNEDMFNNIKL